MQLALRTFAVILGLAVASVGWAAPIELKPASPQPSAGQLKKGLKVNYSLGGSVRSLSAAKSRLKNAKPGKPLAGLNYPDTREGDDVLTTSETYKVQAQIQGYMKFDKPGVYTVRLFSNDGVEAFLGGKAIGKHDGIHGCERTRNREVMVPKAGYYDILVHYFQNKGTACLQMEAAPKGQRPKQVPNSAFFYR